MLQDAQNRDSFESRTDDLKMDPMLLSAMCGTVTLCGTSGLGESSSVYFCGGAGGFHSRDYLCVQTSWLKTLVKLNNEHLPLWQYTYHRYKLPPALVKASFFWHHKHSDNFIFKFFDFLKNQERGIQLKISIKSKVVYLTLPSLYNFIIIRHFSACTLLPWTKNGNICLWECKLG